MILNNKISGGQLDQSIVNDVVGVSGFGFYVNDTGTQTITSTASKLVIDGAGTTSTSAYLPLEIRGSGDELWDSLNNKITPIAVGDSYLARMDLEITSKAGSPTELTLGLDISPTTTILQKTIVATKSTPFSLSITFNFFSLSTFVSNGGELFLETNTGTLTVSKRQLLIHRISSGQISLPSQIPLPLL
jgi:hypothetical protein